MKKKFTPRIEKTEVQTICPLGETIPDFTPKIEKFKEIKVNSNELYKNMSKENNNHKLSYDEVREGSSSIHLADRKSVFENKSSFTGFSTPNCEICKDYPKEYWCGNPKNKVSTPDEEIIEEPFMPLGCNKDLGRGLCGEISFANKIILCDDCVFKLIEKGRELQKALSIKEQEVSKITDEYYNWMKIATDYEKKYKELLSSYYKLQDTLLIERANNRQLLSSLQEKIENIDLREKRYQKSKDFKKELQKIFKEMGQ